MYEKAHPVLKALFEKRLKEYKTLPVNERINRKSYHGSYKKTANNSHRIVATIMHNIDTPNMPAYNEAALYPSFCKAKRLQMYKD